MPGPTARFLCIVLGLAWLAAISPDLGANQAAIDGDRAVREIGSVQVNDLPVKLLIAYSGDSALLQLSVSKGGGIEWYIPMFGSTYRGIPAVTLNVIVSKSRDQLWIRSSWPDSEILAHYRLGADTATTPFGTMDLLATPFPDLLSGGPEGFPPFDPNGVWTLASFYYPGD